MPPGGIGGGSGMVGEGICRVASDWLLMGCPGIGIGCPGIDRPGGGGGGIRG